MTIFKTRLAPSFLWLLAAAAAHSAAAEPTELPHHRLEVSLEPATSTLTVTDELRLGGAAAGESVDFLLNAALELTSSEPPVERVELGDVAGFFGINGSSMDLGDDLELARYRLTVPGDGTLRIAYRGRFDFGLGEQKEEYTRGFRETVGILGEQGVYLAGGSFWVPSLGEGLLSFEMEVAAPAGWHVVSQGDGSSGEGEGRARWRSEGAMEEVYLVGGPLEVYRDAAGAVETLVYLRGRDDGLAGKYLGATAQYLEMYRQLLGPYPYGKFALVENFWETGYGMPSFTLLGPTVIRFPFILHSSYPHEILHNWWGNSVFVDYASGNWCEGLTAYLADHLIQEQRGKGEEYRRGVLQKYRSYVREGHDFPLSEFRSRHSAATEAVGYGKTMMGFHALRRSLGDESFARALQRFYRRHRGERASFADLRASFEETSGEDLGRFFAEWVGRTGAARLGVEVSEVRQAGEGFTVDGALEQLQGGEPFLLRVPVAVVTAEGTETSEVSLDGARASFRLETRSRPLALHVDPAFDVFRQLDPLETPPSIGQLFGAAEVVALLPSAEGEEALARYRELIEAWRSDAHTIEARLDTAVEELPAESSVWVLGRLNLHAAGLFAADPERGVVLDQEGVTIEGEPIPFEGHSLVWVRRHPADVEKAVGWLVVEPAEAFAGMARKLPHYGKYSYLGFEGGEPTNVVKGQWSTADSPLSVDLRPAGERPGAVPAPELASRRALAELPPAFSKQALVDHVAYLAAEEREGRGVGSRGLEEAAAYLAGAFEAAGLRPGAGVVGEGGAGEGGGYLQRFEVEGPGGERHEVANVVGYLPAGRDAWREQSVVVSAHYDHLGRGWPDVHAGDEGEVHPGADDNASGVAVLLELAEVLAAGEPPGRNLVFVAFTAEEAGRLGSRHFVDRPTPFPLEGVRAVVNLDTVGRLGDGKLSVLGTGTADEWQHIFRGSSFVTGVDSRNVPGSAEGSDQWSFIERGIPGVQLTTGPHGDYHRPGDRAEKVDGAGLVKVATFLKEAVVYLGEREEPLTVTIEGTERRASAPARPGGRRVSFGSVPDFAWAGPGVRLGGVTPGSPAERAGLLEGDVLLAVDGAEIADLRAFSDLLKRLEPGQTIEVTFRRGEEERTVPLTVVER